MNEFHLKIPTLNNVMNKFEYIYSAITLILRTCHRIKDSVKCLCFIKDKARETLAPLFISLPLLWHYSGKLIPEH